MPGILYFTLDQQYQSAVKSSEQTHAMWESEMEMSCEVINNSNHTFCITSFPHVLQLSTVNFDCGQG